MKKKKRIYREKFRLKEILKFLLLKYNEKCYFCNQNFNGDFEKITIHHKDFNHNNNNLNNLVLTHRNCHKGFHLLKNRGLLMSDNKNKKVHHNSTYIIEEEKNG